MPLQQPKTASWSISLPPLQRRRLPLILPQSSVYASRLNFRRLVTLPMLGFLSPMTRPSFCVQAARRGGVPLDPKASRREPGVQLRNRSHSIASLHSVLPRVHAGISGPGA